MIGLSTSGNSKNVVNAMEVAKCLGVRTIAMTGKKESKMSELSDVTIRVPEVETYKVQEYHLSVYHYLCAEVEKKILKSKNVEKVSVEVVVAFTFLYFLYNYDNITKHFQTFKYFKNYFNGESPTYFCV